MVTVLKLKLFDSGLFNEQCFYYRENKMYKIFFIMLVLCFNNSFITNINSENIAITNKYFFNNNSSKEEKKSEEKEQNRTIPERIKKSSKRIY